MKTVLFKKLDDNAVIPKYARPGDAGMDLCAIKNANIPSKGFLAIGTGLQMQLPKNTEAQIRSRSGLAVRHGVFILTGTIDEGYRGEIGVVLANFGDKDFEITAGDRIAQMVIADRCIVDIIETKEGFSETERGNGGFGSTGVKKSQK
ncbi:MAG: dUTP diphosphatase [Firmicutes bacterium]|nr:dUTP diphosphatase [Bacillota bacterium]